MNSAIPLQRLEIRRQQPNALFEKWLERWLSEAEKRNNKSQHKLREALQALKSYPLPLNSGRECAILRGFGVKLCDLIDKELSNLQNVQSTNHPANSSKVFQSDVQEICKKLESSTSRQCQKRLRKTAPPKMTKKQQLALAQEEERQKQIIMAPNQFRVVLLLDTQETCGKSKRLLDQTRSYLETLGVEYEVRRLTVGDFLWIARNNSNDELCLSYIVERKRMDDFAASIKDGRFHEQKHRLRNCGIQNVIYLVEDYGDNQHLGLPLESIQQATINTQVHTDFKTVHTRNHWRSMVYLKNMTQALIENFKHKTLIGTAKDDLIPSQINDTMVGLLKFRAFCEDSARNAQLTVREVFVQQLLQLHSLSLDKAVAIVELYPTPRMLFDAYELCKSEEERCLLLSKIPCGQLGHPVGDKISRTVYEFYHLDF